MRDVNDRQKLRKRIGLFKDTLQKFTGLLSSKDIRLIFRGGECYTDGKKIVLPSLEVLESSEATDAEIDDFMRLMIAHVEHEIAHVLFSDFAPIVGDTTYKLIINAFEDVYVERKMRVLWKGAGENFDWATGYMLEKSASNLASMSPITQAPFLLVAILRGLSKDNLLQYFDADLFAWFYTNCRDEISKADTTASTNENCALGLRVYEKLQKAFGESKQQESKQQESKQQESKHVAPVSIERKIQDFFVSLLPDTSGEKTEYAYGIFSTEGDSYTALPLCDASIDRFTKLQRLEALVAEVCGPLRSALSRVLKAKSTSYQIRDLDRGALDRKRLWRVALASKHAEITPRARKDTVSGESYNVAVLIALNTSGSMQVRIAKSINLTRLDMGLATALVLGDVLHALGIKFEIIGHTTGNRTIGMGRFMRATMFERASFTRFGDFLVHKIKNFEASWLRCRAVLASMPYGVNTYDAEAVYYGARRLQTLQGVNRRLLLMLDDGCPCPNVEIYERHHRAALQRAVADVTADNIDVLGVGMATDCVRMFYPQSVVVQDLMTLPNIMLQKLGAFLHADPIKRR